MVLILHLKTTGVEHWIQMGRESGIVRLKRPRWGGGALQFGKERGSIDDPISSTLGVSQRHLFPSGRKKKSLDHHYRPFWFKSDFDNAQ